LNSLEQAAASGVLAALCRRHGLALMVVFGSALDPQKEPADLDLAVRFSTSDRDQLALLEDLYRLTGSEDIDLMILNDAAPVARERALVGGRPLHQSVAGEFANAQIAAIMERLDTDHFRRLQLELMTS